MDRRTYGRTKAITKDLLGRTRGLKYVKSIIGKISSEQRTRGPRWGFAGCGIRPFSSAGSAPKLSRDTGVKYLRDTGLAIKSSRDTGLKLSHGNEVRSKIVRDTRNYRFSPYCAGNRNSRI